MNICPTCEEGGGASAHVTTLLHGSTKIPTAAQPTNLMFPFNLTFYTEHNISHLHVQIVWIWIVSITLCASVWKCASIAYRKKARQSQKTIKSSLHISLYDRIIRNNMKTYQLLLQTSQTRVHVFAFGFGELLFHFQMFKKRINQNAYLIALQTCSKYLSLSF